MLVEVVNERNIHSRLIIVLVNKLLSQGYKVSADHIGYPNGKPEEYKGYTPDIVAKKDGKEFLFEAETCSSLEESDTRLQWTTLSTKPNSKFSVIVPKTCLEKAKKLAKEWKITVYEFWTMDI